jgi:hypothetical protein
MCWEQTDQRVAIGVDPDASRDRAIDEQGVTGLARSSATRLGTGSSYATVLCDIQATRTDAERWFNRTALPKGLPFF